MVTPAKRLNWLVLAAFTSSVIHFADNALRFSHFPEPHWISGPRVVVELWIGITPLLLIGWSFAQRGRFFLATVLLMCYAILSLLVLGHYAYPMRGPMTTSMHAGIALNALAALALLVGAPPIMRNMRRTPFE